jgi:hypothetical protein
MKLPSEIDISSSEWSKLIDEWILSERDRAILKRRLIDGIYYEPLANEFNLSVQRTKEIVAEGKKRLFRHI